MSNHWCATLGRLRGQESACPRQVRILPQAHLFLHFLGILNLQNIDLNRLSVDLSSESVNGICSQAGVRRVTAFELSSASFLRELLPRMKDLAVSPMQDSGLRRKSLRDWQFLARSPFLSDHSGTWLGTEKSQQPDFVPKPTWVSRVCDAAPDILFLRWTPPPH